MLLLAETSPNRNEFMMKEKYLQDFILIKFSIILF